MFNFKYFITKNDKIPSNMFSLFNKPYRFKKFDGYSILDEGINLDTVPYKYAVQFYYQIFENLIKILDIVYSGYPIGEYYFMPVDDRLDVLFNRLFHIYTWFNAKDKIQELKITNLQGFSLTGNFVFLIDLWSSLKDSYFEDLDLLSKMNLIKVYTPPDLQLAFGEIDKLLEEHKIAKSKLLKEKKIKKSSESLPFGAEESITKTIYQMLEAANGEWVTLKDISHEVKLKYTYIRIFISQLKSKIVKYKKENQFKIEASGHGSYRLIIS